MSNSSGIQTLLEAEKKAQETIQEARSFRSQRIKASKTDATKEIEEYRKKKEEEFKSKSSQFEHDEGKAEASSDKASEGEIAELKKSAEKGQARVTEFLVEQVASV